MGSSVWNTTTLFARVDGVRFAHDELARARRDGRVRELAELAPAAWARMLEGKYGEIEVAGAGWFAQFADEDRARYKRFFMSGFGPTLRNGAIESVRMEREFGGVSR